VRASGPGSTYDTGTHYLYLDPGTGMVLDTRSAPTGHLSLFLWELHANLLSGRAGRGCGRWASPASCCWSSR
jgi:hypothetical protein